MANYLYNRMRVRLITSGYIFLILLWLSIVIGIGYAIIHFVLKFW